MGANTENIELMRALEGSEDLKQRGFTAACGPTGGVVVDRWSHVRGVWDYIDGHYFWTPAGHSIPTFRSSTCEGAMKYSLDEISKT